MTITITVDVDANSETGRHIADRIAAGEGVQVRFNITPRAIAPAAPAPEALPPELAELEPLRQELLERGLSERLALVVLLDALGKQRSEIARMCDVSSRTIKWYWEQIYARLDVTSRAEVRTLVRTL